jgi:peptidoglycan LD-endopeptidase CwlK
MDPISEARLAAVHPVLADRIRSMAEMLALENISIRVVQGLRSWAEQAFLYSKGRDIKGNIVNAAQVVTHAKPGSSWHNFGLAVDVAPFDSGIPDWNANHPVWKRIVAVGESCGLIAGAEFRTFPDFPHFQLTGQLPVSPDDAVRAAFETGGIDAVWHETELEA